MVKKINKLVCKEILDLRNKTYEDGLTLLTPTGDRPLAFSLCYRYITAQTVKLPIQWVIADDGLNHLDLSQYTFPSNIEVCHLKRGSIRDKAKSITGNVSSGLFQVKYNKVAIIEDDDYYRPDYLETLLFRLENVELVGEGNSRYYNIECNKFRINSNLEHASLFQTALRSSSLEHLWVSCLKRDSAFIDCRLWNKTSIRKRIFVDKITSIGIKGLPGRPGIGAGHRPSKFSHSFQKDKDWKTLKNWIGEEATKVYIDIANAMDRKD